MYPSQIQNVRRTKITHYRLPTKADSEGNALTYENESEFVHTLIPQLYMHIDAITNTSYLKAGVYPDAVSIVDAIKKATDTNFAFTKSLARYSTIHLKLADFFVFEPTDVTNILGFSSNHLGFRFDNDTWIDTGEFPIDITGGRNLLFVYCDIVEPQFVGDSKSNLLKLLPLTQRFKNGAIQEMDNVKFKEVNQPQYRNVLNHIVDRITITLMSEIGEKIPFLGSGRTSVTLRFKKLS